MQPLDVRVGREQRKFFLYFVAKFNLRIGAIAHIFCIFGRDHFQKRLSLLALRLPCHAKLSQRRRDAH